MDISKVYIINHIIIILHKLDHYFFIPQNYLENTSATEKIGIIEMDRKD